MPRIHQIGKLKIVIYAGDHAPPHFHIRSPESNCQVRIDNLQVMEGEYDPKEYAIALAWASENLEILLSKWEELNERD